MKLRTQIGYEEKNTIFFLFFFYCYISITDIFKTKYRNEKINQKYEISWDYNLEIIYKF